MLYFKKSHPHFFSFLFSSLLSTLFLIPDLFSHLLFPIPFFLCLCHSSLPHYPFPVAFPLPLPPSPFSSPLCHLIIFTSSTQFSPPQRSTIPPRLSTHLSTWVPSNAVTLQMTSRKNRRRSRLLT